MSIKYSDSGFLDGADETKKLSFDVSGVTTGTTRTITMPDGDTKLYTGDGTSGQVLTSGGTGVAPTFQTSTHTPDDNSVTLAKMAHGTDGELITYDATGAPANVAVGTSGQVLTSGGVGVAPTFQTAAGGGGGKLIGWATDTFTAIGSAIIADLNTTSYTPASSSSTIFMTITGVFGKQTSSVGHGLRVALKRRDSAGANEYNVHSDTSGWLDSTSVGGNKAAGAITGTSTGHTGGHAHQWVVRGGASAGGGYNWYCQDARVTIWEVSA